MWLPLIYSTRLSKHLWRRVRVSIAAMGVVSNASMWLVKISLSLMIKMQQMSGYKEIVGNDICFFLFQSRFWVNNKTSTLKRNKIHQNQSKIQLATTCCGPTPSPKFNNRIPGARLPIISVQRVRKHTSTRSHSFPFRKFVEAVIRFVFRRSDAEKWNWMFSTAVGGGDSVVDWNRAVA